MALSIATLKLNKDINLTDNDLSISLNGSESVSY